MQIGMSLKIVPAIAVTALVLVAGCTGGISGTAGETTTGTDSPSTSPTPNAGSVQFYISDEENAISDFRHLNVTISRIGIERASEEDGGWVDHEVDNRTVDLTRLQGANATLIESFDVPNGTYTKVFVHVSDVNATLTTGEQVRVKLPSEKLQIQKEFTVDNGSQVDFVFDISVHKAGNSGKYVLKPVVAESGTDVPIERVDDEERREGLNLRFVGNVSQGENATIEVTDSGEAVANATVVVNEEAVGTTDADGRATFVIPRDEKVTVTVKKGDNQTEREVRFDEGGDADSDGDDKPDEADTADSNAAFVGNVPTAIMR